MKKSKIKIGLIYGGPSSEHEVSVDSAKQIKKYLTKDKYSILDLKISKQGLLPSGWSLAKLSRKVDIVFIALHGQYGEDGLIQAELEAEQVRYTGSEPLASWLASNKWAAGLLAKKLGLNIPQTILYANGISLSPFSSRLVLKPNNGGSSIGVQIINKKDFAKVVKKLPIAERSNLLVQDLIIGREVTVSVLGNEKPQALPVIEIIPKSKFYDYSSKYAPEGSKHIIPANLSKKIQSELQQAAIKIHKGLGCKGMSRSDFIVTKSGKVYYLETNTIPGMTATSLLPQAAAHAGISFPQLLDKIIDFAR